MRNGKMIAVGLMLGSLVSVSSQAAPDEGFSRDFSGKLNTSVEYTATSAGRVMGCIAGAATFFGAGVCDMQYKVGRSTHLSLDASLNVRSAGQGKVIVQLDSPGARKCAGFHRVYKGYEDGFQVYKLYLYSGQNTEPTPYDAHPEALLTLDGSRASITMLQNLSFQTKRTSGNACSWTINTDDAIEMRSQK